MYYTDIIMERKCVVGLSDGRVAGLFDCRVVGSSNGPIVG
jgi:hypothetical protein